MLCQVLDVELELFGDRFFFTHAFFKATAVLAFGGDNQEVGLGCGQNPLSINTHINGSNWVTQARKVCLGVLTHLFVKSNATI